MSDGPVIGAQDLELDSTDQGLVEKQTLKGFRETLEKDFICNALVRNDWNVAVTAEQIGVARPTIYDLIKKYGLRKQDYIYHSKDKWHA